MGTLTAINGSDTITATVDNDFINSGNDQDILFTASRHQPFFTCNGNNVVYNVGNDYKPHGSNSDNYPCDEGSNTTIYGSSRQMPIEILDEHLRL